jgi:hypothetical protein
MALVWGAVNVTPSAGAPPSFFGPSSGRLGSRSLMRSSSGQVCCEPIQLFEQFAAQKLAMAFQQTVNAV